MTKVLWTVKFNERASRMCRRAFTLRYCLAGVLGIASLLGTPNLATAADAAIPAPQLAARPTAVAAQPGSPLGGSQGQRRRRFNLKGALIGAGVGAGLGFWLASTCDAGDCTSSYVEAMGLLGALGAGIGAFTGHPSMRSPVKPSERSSLIVQPVISRRAVGGVVGVAF